MNRVVGADQKIGTSSRQLLGGVEHKLGNPHPIIGVDVLHVLGQRVGMHGNFRMIVHAHADCAFVTDCAVAQGCAFRAAGYYADVLSHDLLFRQAFDLSQHFIQFCAWVILAS